MSTKESQKTILVDLDATLADYKGWDIHGEFPGPPREDVVKGLRKLKSHDRYIGIFSTRNEIILEEWVKKYKLEDLIDFINESPFQPEICSKHKPIAFCYIDDRGIRYDGTNMVKIVDGILDGSFEPWYKK